MITVHFTMSGALAPLTEQLDMSVNAPVDEIKAALNARIKTMGIFVDGQIPQVREVFFIDQCPR